MSNLVEYVSAVDLEVWSAAMEWMEGRTAELFGAARAMREGRWWAPQSLEKTDMGDVYGKFAELRKRAGVLKAKKKDGVKFKVRSADELADRVRPLADELGLLIYPVQVTGSAFVVDSGTLAQAIVTLRVQAISDESYFDIAGFGLGADNQDKAGGKAGTYAWKTALVQALLAGGEKDTDDTDTPIAGGVRRPRPAGAAQATGTGPTREAVESLIAEAAAAKDADKLRRAIDQAKQIPDEATQTELAAKIRDAAATIRGAA